MFTFKVDDDIELRILEERHAEALFELTDRNREHLGRWLPWVDATEELADTLDFIRHVRQAYADNKMIPTGVWHNGSIAGTLGLNGINWKAGSGEIGYWLGTEYQGKGIMTRACRGFVDFAFTELGLNRIVIRCDPNNTRSSAIAERLGFTHEGTARQCARMHDELISLAMYSLLRSEWESRKD